MRTFSLRNQITGKTLDLGVWILATNLGKYQIRIYVFIYLFLFLDPELFGNLKFLALVRYLRSRTTNHLLYNRVT